MARKLLLFALARLTSCLDGYKQGFKAADYQSAQCLLSEVIADLIRIVTRRG
jgi:hypothetical protein